MLPLRFHGVALTAPHQVLAYIDTAAVSKLLLEQFWETKLFFFFPESGSENVLASVSLPLKLSAHSAESPPAPPPLPKCDRQTAGPLAIDACARYPAQSAESMEPS